MRELLLHIARGLVRDPDRVRVREHEVGGLTVLELAVAPEDRGRVIGKDGRTAKAMRTLVAALARRRGGSCRIEVLD